MANTYLTLAELRERQALINSGAPIIDLLFEKAPLFSVLPMVGKAGGIFRYGTKDANPTVSFRGVNDSIDTTKATISMQSEQVRYMEANPWIDRAGVSNIPEELALEVDAQVEAMVEGFHHELIYGDQSVDPNGFDGLYTRILAGGSQFVDGGQTTGSCTSIYAVKFGPNLMTGFYTEGKPVISSDFIGLQPNPDGKKTMGYMQHIFLEAGVAVTDGYAVAQYGSINPSAGGTNDLDLGKLNQLLLKVRGRRPDLLLMNSNIFAQLQNTQVAGNSAVRGSVQDFGAFAYGYNGVPILITDEILDTEAAK
jgi:hypothetical protein